KTQPSEPDSTLGVGTDCPIPAEPRHYRYDVIHPNTRRPCVQPLMGYRFLQETMKGLLAEGRILFGKDERKMIELKVYAKDYRAKLSSIFDLDGRRGTNEIKAIFPEAKRVFDFPKPTGLVEEVLSFVTSGDALILDSFAGSGTTGHAVMKLNAADGGNRKFILVEMEENIARNITAERLKRVINGYGDTSGLGGGFRFATLGTPLFDERGQISGEVRFADLARHVYFSETGEPQPKTTNGKSPLIGVCGRVAYYLLFNGILGDKSVSGSNILTEKTLHQLPAHPLGAGSPRVIFGEGCRFGPARLEREGIVFRQLPYEIRVS
ncbi:MAG: DNA methyltransferase, partial [Phycisphaerae bacterium]